MTTTRTATVGNLAMGAEQGPHLGLVPGHFEGAVQSGGGHGQSHVPRVPPGFGTLPRRGRRILVGGQQEIAHIEMGVAFGRLMDVHMEKPGACVGVGGGQSRLLLRFAPGRVPRTLTGIDVTTGLHPAVQPLVQMEHRSPPTDNDGRTGDVDGIGRLVEGVGQVGEIVEEPGPGLALPGVDRCVIGDGTADRFGETGRPAAVLLLPATWRHACIDITRRRAIP